MILGYDFSVLTYLSYQIFKMFYNNNYFISLTFPSKEPSSK